MKFALVTADKSHKAQFKIDCDKGDCTSFMNWVDIWGGFHLAFDSIREEKDWSYLKDFDAVMFSGHPYYLTDIARIASFLKDSDAVTMFYPEGSVQLFDASMHKIHKEVYDAWRACDVVSAAEEDKVGYYKSFLDTDTIVRFIHVPVSVDMENGRFFVPRERKQIYAVVYGDNNPNHPMVAIACAKRLQMPVVTIGMDDGIVNKIRDIFPCVSIMPATKLSQNHFLRYLGGSAIHFYPTEWIGTAREQVSCASVGTPCIGNHDSHTQKRLFPKELSFDIYDVDGMVSAGKRLLEDNDFYRHVAEDAFRKMLFYGVDATKKRFLDAVDDARRIKQKRMVSV